jgi:hypothetical protein
MSSTNNMFIAQYMTSTSPPGYQYKVATNRNSKTQALQAIEAAKVQSQWEKSLWIAKLKTSAKLKPSAD